MCRTEVYEHDNRGNVGYFEKILLIFANFVNCCKNRRNFAFSTPCIEYSLAAGGMALLLL